jgi:tetratricopeptide (TPR) repeat protein
MINFTSDEEKNGFWELSNTIQAGNYEEALNQSKALLEKFPDNKAIYHNQIGAMTYLSKNDYWGATNHYSKALEYGFDANTCEENIWESAVDSYKSLIDSEAGFCKIMIVDTQEFIWANDLVEKYENLFPNGKYTEEAKELNYIYTLTSELQNNDNYTSSVLNQTYSDKYPNGKHHEVVTALCEIIDRNS